MASYLAILIALSIYDQSTYCSIAQVKTHEIYFTWNMVQYFDESFVFWMQI